MLSLSQRRQNQYWASNQTDRTLQRLFDFAAELLGIAALTGQSETK